MKKDIDKLPKWAQEKITNLKNTIGQQSIKISDLQREIRDLHQTEKQTRIYYTKNYEQLYNLPSESMVSFNLGEDNVLTSEISASIVQDHKDQYYLRILGGHTITVHPEAANVIHIYFRQLNRHQK